MRTNGVILFTCCWTTAIAAPGNYNQQGPKLVGSGAIGSAEQGYSIAVSADGDTAVVGAPGDDNGRGAAWVFDRSNNVWTQQAKLGSIHASPVALSADGNTALIHDSYNTVVFTRMGGAWTQQANLDPGSGSSNVALSGDGNTAFIGDSSAFQAITRCNAPTGGAIYVWTRSSGTWAQTDTIAGAIFVDPNSDCGYGDSLGDIVAASADGNTVAASANGGTNVYTRSESSWSYQTQLGPSSSPVGLTSDGNTLLSANGLLFYRKNGIWSQSGPQLPPGASPSALSGDGSTIVGLINNAGSLSLGLFVLNGGAWILHHQYDAETQAVCQPSTLYVRRIPISLSVNGDTMVEGTPCDDNATGGMRVFAAPQLATFLTDSGNLTRGQTGATYTITVSNQGDRLVHSAVNLVDRIPAGLVATNIAGAGWTCDLSAVRCTRSDNLAVGASYPPVTVTVNVSSDAPASVTNVAVSSGGGSTWGIDKDMTTIGP